MARPRELQEEKKTEQFMVRLPESEALALYRLAASMDIKPAVLCRRWVRLGMAASCNSSRADDNESSSDFASLGDS